MSSRSLKIAFLGYRSHPHVGGQGIYLHYLSKILVEMGHAVDVFSGPPYPELDPRVRLIKIPSLDLYAEKNPTRALRFKHLLSFTDFYEWWSKLSGSFAEPYCFGRRIKKYFQQHKPQYDLIHDNQSLCYGLLDLQKKFPLVATIHHPITRDRDLALSVAKNKGERWLVNRWYNFIGMQQKVVRNLNCIITVSQQSKQDILDAFETGSEKITVISNGVDTDIFKPMPDIARTEFQIITTASSDQPLKGLSILLRSIANIRSDFPNINLMVIGKLKPEGSTEKELQDLGLTHCVQFKSGISTEALVKEYAHASIAVVPSLYEGFGLPAAEALACAMPLVCSDGGALPEVVGDAARLVKAGDVEEMTIALRELLNDKNVRAQLSEKARRRSEEHLSWQIVGQQLENYYFEALRRLGCKPQQPRSSSEQP